MEKKNVLSGFIVVFQIIFARFLELEVPELTHNKRTVRGKM